MTQITVDRTVAAYQAVRQLLDPATQLEPDGRIKDDWLIAIIMAGEFADVSRDAFYEALEATSYQYRDPGYLRLQGGGCLGSCDTVREQLTWLLDVESFRVRKPDALVNRAPSQIEAAQLAQGGYTSGQHDSVIWGNYYPESDMDKYVKNTDPNKCAPWWDCPTLPTPEPDKYPVPGQQHTGPPYTAVDPNNRPNPFVVFSAEQNLSCKPGNGYSCVGWGG